MRLPRFYLTGQRFGRLLARKYAGDGRWECVCDCGNVKQIKTAVLRNGGTQSCGCLKVNFVFQGTHGMTGTAVYRVWRGMRRRCEDSSDPSYKNYGARGISVCDRWQVFECFFEDMGHPEAGMSIERIDVDGNYEPANCKWATIHEQARNKRTNRSLTYQGRTMCMVDWAAHLGLKYQTLARRLDAGWSVEDALGKPMTEVVKYDYQGSSLSLRELAEATAVPFQTIYSRLRRGMSVDEAVAKKVTA